MCAAAGGPPRVRRWLFWWVSPDARRRMQRTRRTGTSCELELRAALRARGLRFRVDWPIPGSRRRADIVFVRPKVAVFVDGCFWHACPRHATWPRSNGAWWREKINANVRRDRATDGLLRASGWLVMRFWEHYGSMEAARRIDAAVLKRKSAVHTQ